MPIIKSAKKRVRVSNKAAVRNAKTKRNLREAVNAFKAALTNGKGVSEAQNKANKAIDTAAKKNVLHKNKAARKKAQLSAAAKAAGHSAGQRTTKAAKTAAKPAKKAIAKSTTKAAPKKAATTKKAAPAKKTAPESKR